ncbi:YD repeat protein [Paucimonas lemoignei]|nr:YD repeat protein [Paucimonas lemoignei]
MNQQRTLISYRYDALDRLIGVEPAAGAVATRIYRDGRIDTQHEGGQHHSLIEAGGHLLAQSTRSDNGVVNSLLGCDQQRSVLQSVSGSQIQRSVYTPYGGQAVESGLHSLLGFNGEQPDPVTGCYLLGNGYRAYNPELMRFHSPDSMSPFESGGVNPYAYCVGDPVNMTDPTGHFSFKNLLKAFIGIAISVAAIALTAATLGASAPLTGPVIFLAAASVAADVLQIVGEVVSLAAPDSNAGDILGYVGLGLGVATLSGSSVAKVAARRGSQTAARFVNKGAGAVAAARQGALKVSNGKAVQSFTGAAKLGRGARNTVALQNRFEKFRKLSGFLDIADYSFEAIDLIDDLASGNGNPSGGGDSGQNSSAFDSFLRGDPEQGAQGLGQVNMKPGDFLTADQDRMKSIREF